MAYNYPLPAFNTPWDSFDCYQHDIRNPFDEAVEHVAFTPLEMSRSPSTSTMHRYLLQQHDRPLCSVQEDIAQPLPGIVHRATFVNTDHCDAWQRQSSPLSSGSGLDSARTSASDRNTPPWSPQVAGLNPPVDHCYNNTDVSYTLGGSACLQRHDSHIDMSCVSLNEIQTLADEQPDTIAFESHSPDYSAYTYAPYPQEGYHIEEGYQPMDSREDSTYYSAPSSECPPVTTTRNVSEEPVLRRRRAPSTAAVSGRVNKRPSNSRRSTSYQDNPIKLEHACNAANVGNRAFPCPLAVYGCGSTFGSKNEWKRHVLTQHMHLGYWRCEQCAAANIDRKPNDFNRKDLFIQHVRRMHPLERPTSNKKKPSSKTKFDGHDEPYLQDQATRCYRHLRDAPERSQCLFCEHTFLGSGTWDERMEHIGRHMEATKKEHNAPIHPGRWNRDVDTEAWLLQGRIIEETDQGLALSDGRASRE